LSSSTITAPKSKSRVPPMEPVTQSFSPSTCTRKTSGKSLGMYLANCSTSGRKIPVVLSASEVHQLLYALAPRERTLVLLDVGTGLRMSELFGLKWKDVDFDANEISVVRSIVMQVTGPCKTESSQKPIPLDPYLAEALRAWLEDVRYNRPEDWVFANPRMKGRQPYWGQEIMRRVIRPIAL